MKKLLIVTIILIGVLVSSTRVQASADQVFLPVVYSYSIKAGVESYLPAEQTAEWYNPHAPLKVSILWSEIEAYPGVYDWTSADAKIGDLEVTWIDIKTSPEWSISPHDPICVLPQYPFWEDFAEFLIAVDQRYHPEYIGIWNEPDVADDSYPEHYGCVGDGQEYGEFVRDIYKQSNEFVDAQIVMGNVADINSVFVDEMVTYANGNYDAVSYHCYSMQYGDCASGCVGDWETSRKLYYVIDRKPVILSETGVYQVWGTEADYERFQVEHFQEMSLRNQYVWFWFTLANNGWPSWMPTDLVDDGIPRPVYAHYMQSTYAVPYRVLTK